MSDTEMALVVLVDGPRCASFYLSADTCLNQLERISRFVSADICIAINHGHTEAKWKGRGQR